MTTTLLNYQLSLIEAATYLAKGIRIKIRDLEKEESKNYNTIPRTLDRSTFRFLIGQVTEYAMNQITNKIRPSRFILKILSIKKPNLIKNIFYK